MDKMTSRERILRMYRHEEADRIPMVDEPWPGTLARWHREGLPADTDWRDFFGFDKVERIYPDISPRYPQKVLEENDHYRIVTTQWGKTHKVFRELDSTPEPIDFYYNTPARWEEAKAKMQVEYDDRIPWNTLKNEYPRWKAEGRFLQLKIRFGFDVTHAHMAGTENVLINLYEDPDWISDIFETYLNRSLELGQRVLDAGYTFDGIFWCDDLGYKGTTFFSPDLYREILKPLQKRAIDWAHERGMLTELHSCGFIEPLLDDLVEMGLDMLNPLEVKAGMDPHRLKAKYGDKLAFRGGINAQLWDDFDAVKTEMEDIIPTLKENGGYVFASDHTIPNSVSLEQMRQIADLARTLGKY